MATLFQLPKATPISAGSSYASAKCHFYQAGTTTNITTYTTAALSVAHANPVVADANGVFAPIFIDEGTNATYKMRLVTSADALIYEVDNLQAVPSQANIGAALWPRTTAETSAGVTPTNYAIPSHDAVGEIIASRYGADGTGATSSTTAIANAILVAKQAFRPIRLNGKLYKANISITGENIHFLGGGWHYEGNQTTGLIADTLTDPAIQIGDGTILTRSVSFTGFTLHGGNTADKGVRIYGASDVYFNESSIRAFEQYQLQLDSSASRSTSYIFFNDAHIATGTTAGSLGVDFNYGASYATAVFFSNSVIAAASGGSYLIDLAASCEIRMTNCWLSGANNQGVYFAAATSILYGQNVVIDSDAATDVLLTANFDGRVSEFVKGSVTVDGVASVTSGNTAALTARHYQPNESFLLHPHVQGALNFQNGGAALNAQHAVGAQNQQISRSGTNLAITSSDGSVQVTCAASGFLDILTGALRLRDDATAVSAGEVSFGKNTQTTVGAAGGASALPGAPTGYLRFFVGATEYVIPYYAQA